MPTGYMLLHVFRRRRSGNIWKIFYPAIFSYPSHWHLDKNLMKLLPFLLFYMMPMAAKKWLVGFMVNINLKDKVKRWLHFLASGIVVHLLIDGFTVLYRHVVGNQIFDESFGHFLVRESQPIDVEFFVIFLYREVAALVNHGNGIILERLHVCQCLCSHSFTRKVGQTEVVVFQQFHKVGGGCRSRTSSCRTPGNGRYSAG